VNGRKNGNGTLVYANGDQYTGEWQNNKKEGYGSFRQRNGTNYIGTWQNDSWDGHGTYQGIGWAAALSESGKRGK